MAIRCPGCNGEMMVPEATDPSQEPSQELKNLKETLQSDIDRGDSWRRVLLELEPGLGLREWPEIGDPNDIEYALVWKPPQGELKTYPNLKAIFSIGAGIDHLASDPELPRACPSCAWSSRV